MKEMLIEISYDKPEYVAELYTTLATYFERVNNSEEQISALNKVIDSSAYGIGSNDLLGYLRS